ncbi:MAG: hypothetical protein V9E85_03310 [Candidatus Nanopelagicales bacterium]
MFLPDWQLPLAVLAAQSWLELHLGTAIAAAVMLVVLGFIVGDPGGVTNPDVVLPGPQTWPAIGYLIAIMLIAIAYPALRRTDVSRARLITAASIAAAISLVSVIGMLMIGGGSVDMPALILIIFPVYTPAAASAVICVFLGIGGTVLVALSLRWTFNELSWLFPSKVEEDLAQDIHEFKPWWAVLSGCRTARTCDPATFPGDPVHRHSSSGGNQPARHAHSPTHCR